MMLSEKILEFYTSLKIPSQIPAEVRVMNPYQDKGAFVYCEKFYQKYYSDTAERTLILGINPGRFGGGITGIPFTDPIKLKEYCNIPNDLTQKPELSADFIYKMIEAYGGTHKFYSTFFISAISPLGFTMEGKNLNYYDSKELQEVLSDFIISCLQKQLSFGLNRNVCFCLGEGKNFNVLKNLNKNYNFFEKIIPLSHPRFIMQYKRKQVEEYVKDYCQKLNDNTRRTP